MSRQLLSRFGRCLSVLLAVTALVLLPLASPLLGWATAAEQETWLDPDHGPTVSNGSNSSWDAYDKLMRQHNGPTGSLTCTNKTLPFGQDALDGGYTSCWYQTKIGLLSDDGAYLQPAGQQYVGLVNGAESQLYPTPNPDVFIELTPTEDWSGYYLDFRTVADAAVAATAPSSEDGPGAPKILRWLHPATYRLENSAGNAWVVDDNLFYSQVAYSNNGKWMTIWDYSGSITRVDLTRFTTRTLVVEDAAGGYDLMAVSDDGRYVVPVVQGVSFRVYDMDKCSTGFEVGGLPAEACTFRPLDQYLSLFLKLDTQTVYGGVPSFVDNGLLSFYTSNPTGEPYGDYFEYLFRAPNTGGTNYIALGDSYASGEGEGNSTFYPETDVHNVNMCHLSKESYPFKIGEELGLDSTHSIACSGARMINILGNGVFDRSLTNPVRTNQYTDEVPSNTQGSWLPGYKAQSSFVDDNKPSIVTISIGGNDVGFKHIIERCVGSTGTCYDSYEDRLELVDQINEQFDDLVATYQQVKNATVADARIYVIGYPSVVKANGDCGLRQPLGFNAKETEFANQLTDYLNSVIKLAADRAGVFYVDVTDTFAGHRLCEGKSSERAVNGLTVGRDIVSLPWVGEVLSSGSFHPTITGHKLLADRIRQATNDFTVPMPRADYSIAAPIPDDSLALLQAPKSNRPTNDLVFIGRGGQIIYRNQGVDVAYTSGVDGSAILQPNTEVRVVIHSQEVALGTFQTDVNGNFSGTVELPDTLKPGFHALDYYALGADGRMQDITQAVYVAANPDDLDGDGTPNSQEPCLIFEVPDGEIQTGDYACEGTLTDNGHTDTPPTTGTGDESQRDPPAPGNDQDAEGPSGTYLSRSDHKHGQQPGRKDHSGNSSHNLVLPGLGIALIVIALIFFCLTRYTGR